MFFTPIYQTNGILDKGKFLFEHNNDIKFVQIISQSGSRKVLHLLLVFSSPKVAN